MDSLERLRIQLDREIGELQILHSHPISTFDREGLDQHRRDVELREIRIGNIRRRIERFERRSRKQDA